MSHMNIKELACVGPLTGSLAECQQNGKVAAKSVSNYISDNQQVEYEYFVNLVVLIHLLAEVSSDNMCG